MSAISKQYENYILDCIDLSGYEGYEGQDKLTALANIFKSETQSSEITQSGLKEWLQGLPSSVGIDFNNYDILQRAKLYGSLPENASEKEEDKLLANYWNYMAMRLYKLLRGK